MNCSISIIYYITLAVWLQHWFWRQVKPSMENFREMLAASIPSVWYSMELSRARARKIHMQYCTTSFAALLSAGWALGKVGPWIAWAADLTALKPACWNSFPQCVRIESWSLWENTRSSDGSPWEWDWCFLKRGLTERFLALLTHKDPTRRCHLFETGPFKKSNLPAP